MTNTSLLQLQKVRLHFGGVKAVNDVDLSLQAGAIHSLIGPNGAGKTTLFNIITGVYQADAGQIHFGNHPLADLTPAKVAQLGVGRTFQHMRLFKSLTVFQNVLAACKQQRQLNLLQTVFRSPAYEESETAMRERARELLAIFNLSRRLDTLASSLSYGEQRKVEIVRALATEPKILLLDEPAAGMNRQETQELMRSIQLLRDKFQLAILLIEHDMHLVMQISDLITVLDHGEVIAHGDPQTVRHHPAVIAAYLGEQTP